MSSSTQLCLQALYYAISIHASLGGGGRGSGGGSNSGSSDGDDDDDDDKKGGSFFAALVDAFRFEEGVGNKSSYTAPIFMSLFVLFNALRTLLPLLVFFWCLRKVSQVIQSGKN